jgi:hypothetical protein
VPSWRTTPVVPTMVLVECLSSRAQHDAVTNRFLKTCDVADEVSEHLARRAGILRGEAALESTTRPAAPGGQPDFAPLRPEPAPSSQIER